MFVVRELILYYLILLKSRIILKQFFVVMIIIMIIVVFIKILNWFLEEKLVMGLMGLFNNEVLLLLNWKNLLMNREKVILNIVII